LIILGHRANTLRWIKRYLKEGADGVEIDAIKKNNRLVALHVVPTRRKRLLRERIGDFLSSMKFTPPLPIEILLDYLPSNSYAIVDLKNRIEPSLVVESIERSGLDIGRVFVSTRFHDEAPSLASAGLKVLLSLDSRPVDLEVLVEKSKASGVSMNIEFLDREAVEKLKEKGFVVASWLINSSKEYEKARRLGVEYAITDYPGILRRLEEER